MEIHSNSPKLYYGFNINVYDYVYWKESNNNGSIYIDC